MPSFKLTYFDFDGGRGEDEHVVAARQERDVPGAHEPVGHRDHVNPHELAWRAAAVFLAIGRAGPGRERVERPARVLVLGTCERRGAE